MQKPESTTDQMKRYLAELPPLTPFSSKDLYKVFPTSPGGRIVSTMHRLSIGTKVSEKQRPAAYFGIKIELGGKEIFLSLPGISTADLQKDILQEEKTQSIISRLQKKYGEKTIDYWLKSAQYRSVSIASGMRYAQKRDGKRCVMCTQEGTERQQRVTACHLVSRRSQFWAAVDHVDKMKNSIFTDEAVSMLTDLIRSSESHSSEKFIVCLCQKHDEQLRQALKESVFRAHSNHTTPVLFTIGYLKKSTN